MKIIKKKALFEGIRDIKDSWGRVIQTYKDISRAPTQNQPQQSPSFRIKPPTGQVPQNPATNTQPAAVVPPVQQPPASNVKEADANLLYTSYIQINNNIQLMIGALNTKATPQSLNEIVRLNSVIISFYEKIKHLLDPNLITSIETILNSYKNYLQAQRNIGTNLFIVKKVTELHKLIDEQNAILIQQFPQLTKKKP